jgi:hypothetical protein
MRADTGALQNRCGRPSVRFLQVTKDLLPQGYAQDPTLSHASVLPILSSLALLVAAPVLQSNLGSGVLGHAYPVATSQLVSSPLLTSSYIGASVSKNFLETNMFHQVSQVLIHFWLLLLDQ